MIERKSRICLANLLGLAVCKNLFSVAISCRKWSQKVLGRRISFGVIALEVRTIEFVLQNQYKSEPTVLDVGANVGQFAS